MFIIAITALLNGMKMELMILTRYEVVTEHEDATLLRGCCTNSADYNLTDSKRFQGTKTVVFESLRYKHEIKSIKRR